MKKILIEIPDDHKRVIDNLVEDGKGYLLPHEVENRMALAIRNGKVLSDMTNGEVIMAMFPDALKSNYIEPGLDMKDYVTIYIGDYEMRVAYDWWNAPYKKVLEESENKVCRGCRYDDGEPHAECVLCDKAGH